jgi:hypothetical protein
MPRSVRGGRQFRDCATRETPYHARPFRLQPSKWRVGKKDSCPHRFPAALSGSVWLPLHRAAPAAYVGNCGDIRVYGLRKQPFKRFSDGLAPWRILRLTRGSRAFTLSTITALDRRSLARHSHGSQKHIAGGHFSIHRCFRLQLDGRPQPAALVLHPCVELRHIVIRKPRLRM